MSIPAITASIRRNFRLGIRLCQTPAAEGTGRVDLFTQRVSQIDIEAHNLVVGVDRFKTEDRRFGGETDGLGCGSGKAEASEQRGNQYFFIIIFLALSVR